MVLASLMSRFCLIGQRRRNVLCPRNHFFQYMSSILIFVNSAPNHEILGVLAVFISGRISRGSCWLAYVVLAFVRWITSLRWRGSFPIPRLAPSVSGIFVAAGACFRPWGIVIFRACRAWDWSSFRLLTALTNRSFQFLMKAIGLCCRLFRLICQFLDVLTVHFLPLPGRSSSWPNTLNRLIALEFHIDVTPDETTPK